MKEKFAEWYTKGIMESLEKGVELDIEIKFLMSTMKPFHASWMVQLYDHLTSECGTEIVVNGWKAAGISDAVNLGSKGLPPLDQFCELNPQKVEIPDHLVIPITASSTSVDSDSDSDSEWDYNEHDGNVFDLF